MPLVRGAVCPTECVGLFSSGPSCLLCFLWGHGVPAVRAGCVPSALWSRPQACHTSDLVSNSTSQGHSDRTEPNRKKAALEAEGRRGPARVSKGPSLRPGHAQSCRLAQRCLEDIILLLGPRQRQEEKARRPEGGWRRARQGAQPSDFATQL
jgi:hypothetical protein